MFLSICVLGIDQYYIYTLYHHMQHLLHTGVQIFGSDSFGKGTGPVLFASLSCVGTEYSPADCTQSAAYSSSHDNDIGVRCLQKGL